MNDKPIKLYCYVDETGQDTMGDFFLVAVVIARENRDRLADQLELIERASGKGRVKWTKVRERVGLDYIKRVLGAPDFKGALYFSSYHDTKAYMALTVIGTAKAIISAAGDRAETTVYVDGLPKSKLRWFGVELRRLSVRSSKVSGVRREEADSLMCLADAVAGFVRLALSGRSPDAARLFEMGKRDGYLKEA